MPIIWISTSIRPSQKASPISSVSSSVISAKSSRVQPITRCNRSAAARFPDPPVADVHPGADDAGEVLNRAVGLDDDRRRIVVQPGNGTQVLVRTAVGENAGSGEELRRQVRARQSQVEFAGLDGEQVIDRPPGDGGPDSGYDASPDRGSTGRTVPCRPGNTRRRPTTFPTPGTCPFPMPAPPRAPPRSPPRKARPNPVSRLSPRPER